MTQVTSEPHLSSKQLDAIKAATKRVNIFDGSVRAGKSVSACFAFLMHVAQLEPRDGSACIIAGKTITSVWRNIIGPILQNPDIVGTEIANEVVGSYGATEVYIFGKRINLFGAHNRASSDSLRGQTVEAAILDEWTVCDWLFFEELLSRCSRPTSRIYVTTNPDSPAHPAYDYIQRIQSGDIQSASYTHFVISDNHALSPEYLQSLVDSYGDGSTVYRRRFLGEWCSAAGAIFPMFSKARHVRSIEDVNLKRWVSVGVDVGTAHASSATAVFLTVDGNLWVTGWSYLAADHDGVPISIGETARRIVNWVNDLAERTGLRCDDNWTVDNAAKAMKVELSDNWDVFPVSSKKDVAVGINTMQGLFSTCHLLIDPEHELLIREIPGYRYDPKKAEQGVDAPVKADDDAVDSLRYALQTFKYEWEDELRSPDTDS